MDTTNVPIDYPPKIPQDLPSDEGTPSLKTDRPTRTLIPLPTSDVLRYRPGVAAVAAFILVACVASSIVRWADDRFFPDPPVSAIICRGPGDGVEILPRGTTVGEALEGWDVDTTGIADKTLDKKIPDGSRITIAEMRAGRRAVIEELSASERYALGLNFDINSATIPDLALIPGIGEASAKKIVAYRKAHGGFLSETSLRDVPGLGNDRARTITRYVSFGAATENEDESEDVASLDAAEDKRTTGPSDKLTQADPPIDINRAIAADLMRIPGVGEKTAARIIECRNRYGAFEAPDDLERVEGIGKKKAEKIGGYVVF
jgi:competence ComEA-like helix-hairpin-helix protein